MGALLVLGLLVVFHLNGGYLPGNDTRASSFLPLSLLQEGDLTVRPSEAPFMFLWALTAPGDGQPPQPVRINGGADAVAQGTAREAWASGRLRLVDHNYYLVSSQASSPGRAGAEAEYVNAFGVGAALWATPLYALLGPLSPNPAQDFALQGRAGKAAAALAVALAALCLWLTLLPRLGRGAALLLALSFALGTSAWSLSSQALWQHGPNELFLCLAALALSRSWPRRRSARRRRGWAAVAGGALAFAVLCRPTSLLYVLALEGFLLWRRRELWWSFNLAGLPFALFLAVYNSTHFGSPWASGQLEVAQDLAAAAAGVWSTPLWKGALGQLSSPSRGLFVFSPFLLFALPGLWVVWRREAWAFLRPLTVGMVLVVIVELKHFDWWSGWSYGYRHLVDVTPILVLLLATVWPWIAGRRLRRVAFGAALVWSLAVQALGAFAYDVVGWNARRQWTVAAADGRRAELDDPREVESWLRQTGGRVVEEVDLAVQTPEGRRRLWSWSDSQILYYLTHFQEARQRRGALIAAAEKDGWR